MGNDTAHGPYETAAEVAAEPLVRDTYLIATAGGDEWGENQRRLLAACAAAGVELGTYDKHVLEWLAGWENEYTQVVIGVISRAAKGGPAVTAGTGATGPAGGITVELPASQSTEPDDDPGERRWKLQTAIRQGGKLSAPVREALAGLVSTVGYMVEMPADESTPPAARWTVAAKSYARLVAAQDEL